MLEYKDLVLSNLNVLGDLDSLLAAQFLVEPNDQCANSIFCIYTSQMKKKFTSSKKPLLLNEITNFKGFLENLSVETLTIPSEFIYDGIYPVFIEILETGEFDEQLLILETIGILMEKCSSHIFEAFSNVKFFGFLFNAIGNTQFDLDCILHLLHNVLMNSQEDLSKYTEQVDDLCDLAVSIADKSDDHETIDKIIEILTSLAKAPFTPNQIIRLFALFDHIRSTGISRQSFHEQFLNLLYHLSQTDSIIFELFEEKGFLELIQSFIHTQVCAPTTLYSCLLICSIYSKFPCKYQFSFRDLLNLILNEDSTNPIAEKCSKAASEALSAQFTALPPLVQHLLHDATMKSILQVAQTKSLETKLALLHICFAFVHESTNETFEEVLCLNSDFTIFDYINDIYDTEGDTDQALQLLLLIFDKSAQFNLIDLSKTAFYNSFDEDFFNQTDFETEEIEHHFLDLRKYFM